VVEKKFSFLKSPVNRFGVVPAGTELRRFFSSGFATSKWLDRLNQHTRGMNTNFAEQVNIPRETGSFLIGPEKAKSKNESVNSELEWNWKIEGRGRINYVFTR
jgi:hypothetical protein